jgi:hypothetical protein
VGGRETDRRPFDYGIELRILGAQVRQSDQGANLWVRAVWHAKPRYDTVATFDADLVDEGLEERPSDRHRAIGEGVCDVAPHGDDLVGVGRSRRGALHGGEQLLAPGAQLAHLGGEPFEAVASLGLGERAGLERREVALDSVFGLLIPASTTASSCSWLARSERARCRADVTAFSKRSVRS